MKEQKTKYYGIALGWSPDDGYWLYNDYGDHKYYDHKPTEIEIDRFRNSVIKY